jgi:dephospho-CoA kinase
VLIGVTGGICTGKSTVARILSALLGLDLVNLDQIAHEILRKGEVGYSRVLEAFGEGILGPDGEIDRKTLGRIVFEDPEKRFLLEGIVHPLVEEKMFKLIEDSGRNLVIEAPLLIEKGTWKWMDFVILVYCPPEVQIKRLIRRDKLDSKAAESRIKAQLSLEAKFPMAHYVVNNDKDFLYLRDQVLKIGLEILKHASRR